MEKQSNKSQINISIKKYENPISKKCTMKLLLELDVRERLFFGNNHITGIKIFKRNIGVHYEGHSVFEVE